MRKLNGKVKKIVTIAMVSAFLLDASASTFSVYANSLDSGMSARRVSESMTSFEKETIGKYKDDDTVKIIVKLKDNNVTYNKNNVFRSFSFGEVSSERSSSLYLNSDSAIKKRISETKRTQDDFLSRVGGSSSRRSRRSVSPMSNSQDSLTVRERFNVLLNGLAITTTYARAKELSRDEAVAWVQIEAKFEMPQQPMMKNSSEIVNAGAAWDLNYKGKGKVIAVIDSGADHTHEALSKTPEGARYPDKDSIDKKIASSGGKLKGKFFSPKVPYGLNYADDKILR